jgi:WD repeat-containing protein 19
MDNTGSGYLYNPVNDQSIMLPNFSANTEKIIWDLEDPNVFCSVETEKIQTYIYFPFSLEGATVVHLQEYLKLEGLLKSYNLFMLIDIDQLSMGVVTKIETDLKPIILKNGYVFCHSKSEGIRGQHLATHSYIENWRGIHVILIFFKRIQDTEEGHYRCFLQNLALNRFSDCFKVAKTCGRYSLKFFEVLGRQSLKVRQKCSLMFIEFGT